MLVWIITFILAFVEVWVLIESGKADRRSNRIGAKHWQIWQSGLYEVLVEIVLLVTGVLVYSENHWLIVPTCIGVLVGTVSNKYLRQYKFKKQQFKPKQSSNDDEDEEENL